MNVTDIHVMLESSPFVDEVWKFILATRAELFLFCAAVAAYLLLFGNASPKGSKPRGAKTRRLKVEEKLPDDPSDLNSFVGQGALSVEHVELLENSFSSAFEVGDHRQVVRCWTVLKRSERMPNVSLAQAVESMQRFKKDPAFVLRELRTFFKKHPTCDIATVNELLESLAKRMDSDLVAKVVQMMPAMSLEMDQRTYEILLSMNFTMRSFNEVRLLLREMQTRSIPLSTRANIVAVKSALKTGNFEEAKCHFKDLKSLWSAGTEGSTVSTAPRHIVCQLIDLACKEHQLSGFLELLEGVPITEDAVSAMLSECIRRKDRALTEHVERIVRDQGHQLSDATYTLLVKSLSNDGTRVHALFDEVVEKGTPISSDFALALLSFAGQTRSMKLADRLFDHMAEKPLTVLIAFIRFYADVGQPAKACDVYEKHLLPLRSHAPMGEANPSDTASHQSADSSCKAPKSNKPLHPCTEGLQGIEGKTAQSSAYLDGRVERILMSAALECGRHYLAKTFLDASPLDVAKHITMIRSCGSSGNLDGVFKVFETLKKSGTEMNSVVYNTVLDACVECRDLRAAESWMAEIKKATLTDVVSYNTLIKAYLQAEQFSRAREVMEEMRREGLHPNRVTFNELVNGLVTRGSHQERKEMWSIIREMKSAGVKPNQVTCSILLKSLNSRSQERDIHETMDLIGTMDEPMDEVLLSSVVEACVRIGKPDLLAAQLKQIQGAKNLAVTGSHTFGSLIKAYGHAKDVSGVWRCWKEMRSRHIRPTSITLGCMVEAVVSNGDTEGAYDLIHQMQEDERCRDVLNAVIYCSVLKGFTREKKVQRVWAVYEEMLALKVELSIVTYNTLLDACARCGRMDRSQGIVDNMREHGITPNLITYSTIVKGHCQAGNVEKGFAVLEKMKAETKLKPDEIMYNSLLDGCAQNNLLDEGLAVLKSMEDEHIRPSNFTLSLVVKLMNRCRKLDMAFRLVDEIASKYDFRLNVHVFTNLIQACIVNRQLQRGMDTFTRMLRERVQPENRTYSILIRASLTSNQLEQACTLLRAALGIPCPKLCTAAAGMTSTARNLDMFLVNEVLHTLIEKGCVQDLALPLLSDFKRHKPQLRIDAAVQRRIMSAGLEVQEAPQSTPAGSAVSNGGGASAGKSRGRGGRCANTGSWRS